MQIDAFTLAHPTATKRTHRSSVDVSSPRSTINAPASGVVADVAALVRHARPCAGHPRLSSVPAKKAWMAGTSSAKTRFALLPGHDGGIRKQSHIS
jgi:hypothetical protein